MARRTRAAAAVFAVLALSAGFAAAQAPAAAKPAAPAPAKGAAPAAAKGAAPAPMANHKDPKTFITIVFTNECKKTVLAAIVADNLEGKSEAQGFWRLAPGESAEAAHTKNRTYYVYAHELGDPECTLGCWAGKATKELQGEKWPFLEKTMKPSTAIGTTVSHKFTC